jgi:dTDP-4-dehydrorhamnose reductase
MNKKILLTGASGNLGQTIVNSGKFPNVLTPEIDELDIRYEELVRAYLKKHDIDTIIHCAAIARMKECEDNPEEAEKTNVSGTSNLVRAVIEKEKSSGENIRFLHISTDGVYNGTKGEYSEEDKTVPYNTYGKTKLKAENLVKGLSNFCIIRTSFFDPENIRFEESASDAFSSKIPINELVEAIAFLVENEFIGIINVGSKRKSDYERYSEFKNDLKECSFEDIQKNVDFKMAKDASMNCEKWEKLRAKK